jgi:hypothetical protein
MEAASAFVLLDVDGMTVFVLLDADNRPASGAPKDVDVDVCDLFNDSN